MKKCKELNKKNTKEHNDKQKPLEQNERDNRSKLSAGQTPEAFQQKAYRKKVCVKLLLSK